MREDTTGEVLTITNNGQENHLVKMAFLELKKYRETSKDAVRKPWLEFFGNKPFDMVRQGILTPEIASQQLGMTVAEFESLLKDYH